MDKNPGISAQMELARQAVLIRAFIQDYVKKHPISDAQLKSEYDAMKAKLGGTEYKSRHILVETEDQAKNIIDNLKKGAKFDELGKQSKDPGPKENGGDLGWSAAGSYVPPFAEALTKLSRASTGNPGQDRFRLARDPEDSRPLEAPAFEAIKTATGATRQPAAGREDDHRPAHQGQGAVNTAQLQQRARPQTAPFCFPRLPKRPACPSIPPTSAHCGTCASTASLRQVLRVPRHLHGAEHPPGCGIMIVKRPSAVVTPVRPAENRSGCTDRPPSVAGLSR